MAISDIADEYFAYEARLASFHSAQQLSKRRGSTVSTKAPKSLKWPHKWMSTEELAKAGFFYYPSQDSPDNVACFLCRKNIDGWEKGDDPLVEHLKHSPDCGWAIVAMIERQDGEFSEEYPSSTRMIDARKATFADKWPHESKKGWKCKIKQMVDAGWKFTPTLEYDDMATCTYCNLALDGWENGDKPLDEHFKRSPECSFFLLINNHKQSPKRTKSKKGRASKISRLSTQSAFTIGSDTASIAGLPAEEGDSILTTATNATVTTQGGRKMGKAKKGAAGKGRKTKAKKDEAVGVVPAPEPEDDDFEVKVDVAPKPTRGRKRKSDESVDLAAPIIESQPPAKRRATRTRASTAFNDNTNTPDENSLPVAVEDAPNPGRKKGRPSAARSTRKVSAASVASLRASIPNDDEIDAALEADLERHLTDDEAPAPPPKKGTRSSKISKADHAMFGTSQIEIDEAAIKSELQAMEAESKPLPKARGAKGKQPRKVSAKEQASARKAAEAAAEAEAQRLAEEEASQQIAAELEHSLSIHQPSPVVQPKRQRASSRQPSRQPPGGSTRASVLTIDDSNVDMVDEFQDALDEQKGDSGNETDASKASQSTVVRGGSIRRGSTVKKGRGGKKAAISKHIEEIVQKPQAVGVKESVEDLPIPTIEEPEPAKAEDTTLQDEAFFTPAPEFPDSPKVPGVSAPLVEEPAPNFSKTKTAPKGGGRAAKATPASIVKETLSVPDPTQEAPFQTNAKVAKGKEVAPPRSPTPPPKEITPVESPQSSDAENHPPSSQALASIRKPTTPHSAITCIPLASTPMMSPSKRNIIAGLQSAQPWTAVDLDAVFIKSPSDENGPRLFGEMMVGKVKGGDLTSPEKKMTVEEWIHYIAEMAEEKLRGECERMVGAFEREGGRAMRSLEGVECVE